MKKRRIVVVFLLLALVSVIFTGCGNPYAGNYQEVTEEEKINLVNKIAQLEEAKETYNMELSGSSNITTTFSFYGETQKVNVKCDFTELYDYTNENGVISYVKYNISMSGGGVNAKLNMEGYVDVAARKAYVTYDVSANGIKKNISGTINDIDLGDFGEALSAGDTQFTFRAVYDAIQLVEVTVSVSDNKVKVTDIKESKADVTYYLVFESDNQYRAKKEYVLDYTESYYTYKGTASTDIYPVKKSCSLPTDLSKYSQTINIYDLSNWL